MRILDMPTPENEDGLFQLLEDNRLAIHDLANILVSAPGVEFEEAVKWTLNSLSQPPSPLCMESVVPHLPSRLCMPALLTLANAIIRAPNCTQSGREFVIGQVATNDFLRPATNPGMDPPPACVQVARSRMR